MKHSLRKPLAMLTFLVAVMVFGSGTHAEPAPRLTTPSAPSFAQGWAQVPRTAAGRAAQSAVIFGVEQSPTGFNVSLGCCNEPAALWMGASETLHGAFLQNQRGQWSKDLVSSASADSKGVSYTIKASAYWYWGGRKIPVTYRDFVYTLQQLDDPNNNVASRVGYANLNPSRFTHKGMKEVTFYWRKKSCSTDFPCGPYADWQSIFSLLYPSFALRGANFNRIWMDCICSADGRPVSDGPYYLASYTKGQGAVLKANPFWAGRKPSIKEVDFKVVAGVKAEVEAIRSGTVDVISPQFDPSLAALKSVSGITFNETPGYYFEHLEFREGSVSSASTSASHALLRAPYIREAISLAIDRQALINAVYGQMAAAATPLNSAIYYQTESAYQPDFARWNYNPQKALALMAKHCTGGPSSVDSSNTRIWSCSGLPAVFSWSYTAASTARQSTEALAKSELQAIGIQISDSPQAANIFFGPAGLESGNFDIADLALATSGDPADWEDVYACGGTFNYTGYCSHKLDSLLTAANRALSPATRTLEFQKADESLALALPVLPLYQEPDLLIYKSSLIGVVNDPAPIGPLWSVEDWRWKADGA